MKEIQSEPRKLTTYQFASQYLGSRGSKTSSVFSQPHNSGRLHNNYHFPSSKQKIENISISNGNIVAKTIVIDQPPPGFSSRKIRSNWHAQNIQASVEQNKHHSSMQKSSHFSCEYRDNLFKTIYKETKKVARNNRQRKMINGRKRREMSKEQLLQASSPQNNIIQTIPHNREISYRRITERKSRVNTLQKQKTIEQTSELDIAQFPLIQRKYKIAAVSDLNKIFQTIRREVPIEPRQPFIRASRRNFRQSPRRSPSRSPSRQDILPWDTFTDNFES